MEQLRQRYAPGRRENSFFVDASYVEQDKDNGSEAAEDIFEYTYYMDSDGSLIKEKI